jgi:hypothetical protein
MPRSRPRRRARRPRCCCSFGAVVSGYVLQTPAFRLCLNPAFPGRREVHELTGNYQVPTLVLDDGSVIDWTANIVAWAAELAAVMRNAATIGSTIRSAKMKAITPAKLMPPLHSTAASGTLPTEQTKLRTAMTGPIKASQMT